jgi:hypothetical protein
MSWLYSRVLVEEYLGENYLDGEQSAPLNGSLIQQAYCAPDKMTDFSRLSRFGMTYKPLTENLGGELLTLFRAGFHAKTYPQPEKAQGLTENDPECGVTWRGWLAKYDPNTSLWRTAQCSLLEDLNESLATLPRSGMTRNGLLWELPMLEQTTKEIGFGLLPTPTTQGLNGGSNSRKAAIARGTWPTPRSCSAMAATITPESAWNEKRNPNLETIVGRAMFPTPTCHNAKEGAYPAEFTRNTPTLATHAGGKLNPTWVEWLMGWPLEWTDLKPLVTGKSHCVQQQHGKC